MFPNSIKGRKRLKYLQEKLNKKETAIRKSINEVKFSDKISIELSEKEFSTTKASKKLQKILIKFQKMHNNVDWEKIEKVTPKSFLHQYYLNPKNDKDLQELIFSDEILGRVTNYLGEIPILSSAALWNSPNKKFIGGSQFFHIDGEGLNQIRVLLPLKDIKNENGPFTCVELEKSQETLRRLFKNNSISTRSDRIIDKEIPKKYWKEFTGKLGDIQMVDTNSCYHFGSRPKTEKKVLPRTLLSLHFISHTCADVPAFVRMPVNKINDIKQLVLAHLESGKMWNWKKDRWKYHDDKEFIKSY